MKWGIGVLLVSNLAMGAIYKIGDKIRNDCWFNEQAKKICVDDFKNHVRIFIFSAGWCGPCNREIDELVKELKKKEFYKKPVTFLNILAEGYSNGSQPDTAFLKDWKKRHAIPFDVLGHYRNFGSDYSRSSMIPFVAVIGKDTKLKWTATGSQLTDILKQVRLALKL